MSKDKIDYLMIILIVLLLGIGLSMLFSASYYHSEKIGKGPLHIFNKQLLFVALGAVAMIFAARVPLAAIRKTIPLIVLGTMVFSLLPFAPGIGKEINGARRWVVILDYTFQPSELIKLAVVLYVASILEKKADRIDDPLNALLPPFIIVFIFSVIIFFQNDLSTSFFILFIALAIFYIAQIRLVYFAYLGSLIIPLGLGLLLTGDYWRNKLMTFLDPTRDPFGMGFQVRHAKIALEQGGFFGKGVGMSTQKLGFLPEPDSDFIFAITGEEIGFIGIFFIIVLFALFTFRGYVLSWKSKDKFKYYLGFGITTTIIVQAVMNMAVTIGLMPTTGMPLPFFSLGGSAMLVTLFMCGLLINISRSRETQGGVFNG
ncbi:MAG: putative lipid II flippase FtsW [Spirochaetaceae bacterium]|nr:MAG: putative lipid II flippase FtsW [Spirochaetaceae bacterium]